MAVNCEKVVNDLFAPWTRLNVDEVMGCFARAMTHDFMKDKSAFSAEIVKTVHDGNVVFNERVDEIVMENGKKVDVPVVGMFELNEAGKIKVWRDYFDLATFTKQTS